MPTYFLFLPPDQIINIWPSYSYHELVMINICQLFSYPYFSFSFSIWTFFPTFTFMEIIQFICFFEFSDLLYMIINQISSYFPLLRILYSAFAMHFFLFIHSHFHAWWVRYFRFSIGSKVFWFVLEPEVFSILISILGHH